MANPFPAQKNSEYLSLARQSFCDRYGVSAPHEAIDRRLATITDWCQHINAFRVTPLAKPSDSPLGSSRDEVSNVVLDEADLNVTGALPKAS
jgi:hypothetical protein